MTLTPCDLALAAIAAPEPESRLTSSRTLAPLVMACSACCCWVDLSPSAFWISDSTPAASKAFFRNGRSTVSQRTEDLESGSSTATLPAFLSPPPPPELLELLSSPPHAATGTARAATPAHSASRFHLVLTVFLLVGLPSDAAPVAPRDARTARGPARARRAPARAPPGPRPRPARRRPRARSHSAPPPRASGRAAGRPPR